MSGAFAPGGSATVAFALVGALGLGLRLVGPRVTRTAGLVALLAGQLGTVVALAPHGARTHAPEAVGAVLVALAVGALLGAVVDRRPALLLCAIAAAVPLRLPVPVGGSTSNLLLPLYVVVGLGLLGLLGRELRLAWLRRRLRRQSRRHAAEAGSAGVAAADDTQDAAASAAARQLQSPPPPRTVGWLPRADPAVPQARTLGDIAVATVTFIWCASLAWTLDPRTGDVHVGLFILPFATCYLLVGDAIDRLALRGAAAAQRGLAQAGATFVAVLAVAAACGLVQAATHHTWQNPKVRIANLFQPDFRTNSIFWDPNVYGRYVVAALLALGAWALFAPRLRRRAGIVVTLLAALLALGLWHSYSQSSFLELAAGAVVLAMFVLERRGRRVAVVLAVVAVAIAAPVAAKVGVFHDAGRLDVAQAGARLAAEEPATGLGIGSFSVAYERVIELQGGHVPKLRESHLTPVTIAVEQGIYGLCAYTLFLLALSVGAVEARRGAEVDPGAWTAARWGAALAAGLVVHSMLYASWFEDPLTWIAAAVLVVRPVAAVLPEAEAEA